MKSEKVKEIKKALYCCTTEELLHPCEECPYTNDCKCEVTLHTNILTLINELENENKSLQDLCNKTYEDLTKEIDRLWKLLEEEKSKNNIDSIKKTMAKKKAELDELAVYELLAKQSPEMANLLSELKELL